MSLMSVRDGVHTRYLKLRALDRIVHSTRFAAAFRLCKEDDTKVDNLIEAGNADGVEAWVNGILEKELEDLSMRELRTRAHKLGIPYYTTFRKDALILKILEVQSDARKTEQAAVDVPSSEAEPDPEDTRLSKRELSRAAS